MHGPVTSDERNEGKYETSFSDHDVHISNRER